MKLFNVRKMNKEILFITRIVAMILMFLILQIITSKSLAQSPDDLMKTANNFYQEQQYDQAVISYNRILTQGFESSSLYYNLGNSYFKTGNLGYAILNYEKGLKLSPGDEDLIYNLKIANARTVDKITQLPKIFIVQWWELLVTSFTLTGWSIITILIFWIFLAGIALFLLSRRARVQRASLMISSITLALLILVVVILISRYNHEAITDYGILTEEVYSVKVAPDYKSNDLFVIHEGIKFIVDDRVNEWYKIRLADGKVGWIPQNVFGKI